MKDEALRRLEFDMRGQICPSTLLTALKEINDHSALLRSGEVVLAFRSDNREATVTIPESAANMGYAVQVEKDGDHYVIEVRREGAGDAP